MTQEFEKDLLESIKKIVAIGNSLLHSTPNPEPSVATESDQGGADGKQNLEALREKFNKECVTGSNFPVFTLRYESPDEVFNWFIPYLK